VLMSYVTGVAVLVGVMVLWVGVQSAWRNVFARTAADPDVLAGRLDCGNCGCTESCERESRGGSRRGENP